MTSKGYRIVTTDAEVISPSGAKGGKFKNKSANILNAKNEIKELSEA